VLKKLPGQPVTVFAVWEQVLSSDSMPISRVLARIPDLRVTQFWDPGRVLSHHLGETEDRKSIVWDWVAVYPIGSKWGTKPVYSGRPVVKVAEAFEDALRKELARR
jgi:hypothetical protein